MPLVELPREVSTIAILTRAALAHLAQDIVASEAVALDFRLGPYLRIDRNEITLARRLIAKAVEVEQCRRAELNPRK